MKKQAVLSENTKKLLSDMRDEIKKEREERLKSSRSQTSTECCTAVSEANVQHDGNRRLVARSAAPKEPSVSQRAFIKTIYNELVELDTLFNGGTLIEFSLRFEDLRNAIAKHLEDAG